MSFLIRQTLIYAVPLMIVALAGIFAERSGIINLALEGIMIFGAFIGVLFVRLVQQWGWFAAANRYSLAPTELQMLQADIATLRGEFDTVFMFMPDGLRRGGSFFSQLLGVCESAMIEIGAGATPRAELDYARRHVVEAGKPMMGIATGASARVVRREMEARK